VTTSQQRSCDRTPLEISVAGSNARGSRLAETDQRLSVTDNGAGGSTDDCCKCIFEARQFLMETKTLPIPESRSSSYRANCRIRWRGDNAQYLHSLLDDETSPLYLRHLEQSSTSQAFSEEARTKSTMTAALKHLGSIQKSTRRGTRLFHRKSNTILRLRFSVDR
jgi:hypothetical protein